MSKSLTGTRMDTMTGKIRNGRKMPTKVPVKMLVINPSLNSETDGKNLPVQTENKRIFPVAA